MLYVFGVKLLELPLVLIGQVIEVYEFTQADGAAAVGHIATLLGSISVLTVVVQGNMTMTR